MLKVTNENYCCSVVKIRHLIDLPGLNNLKGFSCFGQMALVGGDVKVGDVVLFFGPETKLSHDFCHNNNLYRDASLNKDPQKTGFFEKGRVKSLKLRGHVSTAFVCPLSQLAYTGADLSSLEEGNLFNEINGVEVCTKYKVPRQIPQKGSVKAPKKDFRIDTKLMPEHIDTAHYLKHDRNLPDDAQIVVTAKLHGVSARFAYQVCKRKLTLFERVAKFFGCKVQETEYDYFAASRRVIKDTTKNNVHFYENDIWNKELEKIKGCIPKGWQIFGEIIGWDGEKPLMSDYTYDVPRGQTELYVYRIACVNSDGMSVDLSWEHVKLFCINNGIKYVPELYVGPKSGFDSNFYMDKRYNDIGLNSPKLSLDKWNNGKEDIKIVDEGVCIRINDDFTPHFYKHKAPLFYLHEGVILDSGVEDVESKESEVDNENI